MKAAEAFEKKEGHTYIETDYGMVRLGPAMSALMAKAKKKAARARVESAVMVMAEAAWLAGNVMRKTE